MVIYAPFRLLNYTETMATGVSFNSSINDNATDMYAIMPQVLPLDLGQMGRTRMGLQIEPKSLKLKIQLVLKGTSSFGEVPPAISQDWPDDILVTVFVLTCKYVKDQNDFESVNLGELMGWQEGFNTTSFSGLYSDNLIPVNKTKFNVISRKTIRLAKGFGFQSFTNLAQNLGPVTIRDPEKVYPEAPLPIEPIITQCSTAKAEYTVDIPCPKTLKYDDNNSGYQHNWFPFMVCGWTPNTFPLFPQQSSLAQPFVISAQTYFKFVDI